MRRPPIDLVSQNLILSSRTPRFKNFILHNVVQAWAGLIVGRRSDYIGPFPPSYSLTRSLPRLAKYYNEEKYRNTSATRHRSIRWITILKYKNVSLIRHHAHNSNAFPFPQIGTVKAWCFPILFVQSPKLNAYLRRRYCLKCCPMWYTYKEPL